MFSLVISTRHTCRQTIKSNTEKYRGWGFGSREGLTSKLKALGSIPSTRKKKRKEKEKRKVQIAGWWWHMLLIPVLRRLKQEDCHKSEARLDFPMSSRPAWTRVRTNLQITKTEKRNETAKSTRT